MRVIVPCDFTKVVPAAMSYAVRMSATENVQIDLLHIYEGGASGVRLTKDQVQIHLEEAAQEYAKTYGVTVQALLREGTIESTISEVAEERHADYVVMGTHGISGMQRFFGSKAIKVVSQSDVPFLIVQEPAGAEVFKRLLMPLGARQEDVEKLNWCVRLLKEYGSELYVVPNLYSDPKFQRKVNANLALLERLCSTNGLRYEVHAVQKGKRLTEEMNRVAKENKCDWVLIMITQNVGGIATTFNSTDQEIMANGLGIPVMCVNPATSATPWQDLRDRKSVV